MEKYNIVFNLLSESYPEAKCELVHKNSFELLIAVMLSAQCTDKRVNQVTKQLFEKYKCAEDFVKLGKDNLQEIIKSCGLYKNKSMNIIDTCKMLLERFYGKVPNNIVDLTSFPGVGRKTANVILSNAFGVPTIPVDTHVFRVSNRIGLVQASDVQKTEKQLMDRFPKERWIDLHHMLISHGRQKCYARKPECIKCKIKEHCDFTNGVFK